MYQERQPACPTEEDRAWFFSLRKDLNHACGLEQVSRSRLVAAYVDCARAEGPGPSLREIAEHDRLETAVLEARQAMDGFLRRFFDRSRRLDQGLSVQSQ